MIDVEEVVHLIPLGYENAKPLEQMVKIFDGYSLLEGVSDGNKGRRTRDIISRVGIDYVVCNLSDGRGYFRPTIEDEPQLRKWVAQEKNRAMQTGRRVRKGSELLEDFYKNRCEEQKING